MVVRCVEQIPLDESVVVPSVVTWHRVSLLMCNQIAPLPATSLCVRSMNPNRPCNYYNNVLFNKNLDIHTDNQRSVHVLRPNYKFATKRFLFNFKSYQNANRTKL